MNIAFITGIVRLSFKTMVHIAMELFALKPNCNSEDCNLSLHLSSTSKSILPNVELKNRFPDN